MGKKMSYEEVKNFIEIESNSGCILLSKTYNKMKDKLVIECPRCKKPFEASLSNFKYKAKRQCNKCSAIQYTDFKTCSKCKHEKPLNDFNKNGKLSDGDVKYSSWCKTCDHEYKKEYYLKNKDYVINHVKEYRDQNKDKISQQHRKYYAKNKEQFRLYRIKNKERIQQHMKEYRIKNKEYLQQYNKEYRIKNKEVCQIRDKNNRLKNIEYYKLYNKKYFQSYYQLKKEQYIKRANDRRSFLKNSGSYTAKQFKEMLNFFNYECAYSGEKISNDLSNMHREHVIPVSKGGVNFIWNIVPSVPRVNLSKNNKDMEAWYRQQTYFSEERLAKIYEWQKFAYEEYGQEPLQSVS